MVSYKVPHEKGRIKQRGIFTLSYFSWNSALNGYFSGQTLLPIGERRGGRLHFERGGRVRAQLFSALFRQLSPASTLRRLQFKIFSPFKNFILIAFAGLFSLSENAYKLYNNIFA